MVTRLEAGDKGRERKREADGGWVSDAAVRQSSNVGVTRPTICIDSQSGIHTSMRLLHTHNVSAMSNLMD